MSFILPLMYILLSNATMVQITRRSFGICLPLTLMLSAFSLFLSQIIFDTFNVGFVINIAFSLMSIAILIFSIKNKKINEFKKNYFSNAFYIFIGAYLAVFIYDFRRTFTNWDEWSHWGVMIKEMLRLDKFYTVDSSVLQAHKDYPPIVQLFELNWIKLCGMYSEAKLIRSLHLLEVAFFIPYFDYSTKEKKSGLKNLIVGVCVVFIMLLTILFFDEHGVINSIYLDYLMSFEVAFIAVFSLTENKLDNPFSLLTIGTSGSFLLLTKQMGLPLYAMCLFILICRIAIDFSKTKQNIVNIIKSKYKIVLMGIILILIIPFTFYFGWSAYTKNLNIDAQFVTSDIKITKLKSIVFKYGGEPYQQEAASNYITALKTFNFSNSYFQLTYGQAIALILFLLFFVGKYGQKRFNNNYIKLLFITIIIGAIGYAFVMLCLYVFCFGDYEGPRLASINRYMQSYIFVGTSIVTMIYYYSIVNNKYKIEPIIILLTLLFICQSAGKLSSIFPAINKPSENIYEIYGNYISSNVDDGAKVFILAQNSEKEYNYFVKYYANPIITNMEYYSWDDSTITNTKNYFDKNIKKYLSDYDYIFIAKLDDNFSDKYSWLFNGKIENGQLYKIDYNDDILTLKLVN